MKLRSSRGTTIAEMPLALWIIIMMCFCMLILATESMRFGFFWNACREAAQQAAKCQTFLLNSSVGPSACNTASTWAQTASSSFTGITLVQPVNVYILSTNVISGVQTKNPSWTPLPVAADTTNNIYDIQVELNGQIAPLIAFSQSYFGNVPGLTVPFSITVRSQYTSEVPQGLNQ